MHEFPQLENFSMRFFSIFYDMKFNSVISKNNVLLFPTEGKAVKGCVIQGCGTSMRSGSQKSKF